MKSASPIPHAREGDDSCADPVQLIDFCEQCSMKGPPLSSLQILWVQKARGWSAEFYSCPPAELSQGSQLNSNEVLSPFRTQGMATGLINLLG